MASTDNRGVRFPKRTRLPADAYANRSTLFHVTIAAHPEIRDLSRGVRDAIWLGVLDAAAGTRIDLLAACLMPDHLHLALRPADIDLLAFVRGFKSWTSRASWGAGHTGALWQPGMWDRTVREGEAGGVVRYILENPVRARLVDDAAEWPWTWVKQLDA